MDDIFFISLRSGSSGNGYIISDGVDSILFDAGIPKKLILQVANEHNIPLPSNLLISHEHTDHIKNLNVITRTLNPTVYSTAGTLGAILHHIRDSEIFPVSPGSEISIGKFAVRFIPTPHDSAQPVSFLTEHISGKKIALITDIGNPCENVIHSVRGANIILIESNYEPRLLKESTYPSTLKTRIAGKYGHLSNIQCVDFVQRFYHHKLQTVILGHLSENNNRPELAFGRIRPIIPFLVDLHIAHRYEPMIFRCE
ncbi:hypothetical protein DRQ33_00700 [bacterium]|nr:MAG: hypothetical protein DRQ33_00700 [bacterium]